MKTTVDIPDELLKEAMKYSRAATKREAVVTALEDYTRRQRQAAFVKHLGTFKDTITSSQLRELRQSRMKRHGLD